jgi:hypothetical protein
VESRTTRYHRDRSTPFPGTDSSTESACGGGNSPTNRPRADAAAIAKAWHGADIAYFVNILVAALPYGGYRLLRTRNP